MDLSLSVVIPTFNGARTIGLQLQSLASQLNAPAFEVIVVDNGSTDAVRQVVSSWSDQLILRCVDANEHQGVSYARNVGVREARAVNIAFCDDDDCTGEGWVAAACNALNQVEFVTGSVTDLPDDEFQHGLEHVRSLAPQPTSSGITQRDGDRTYPIVMGGNCAMTRALALKLEGFDQSFFPGAEDNDLGLRLVRSGHTLYRCESMVVLARTRPSDQGAWLRSYQGGLMHMQLCARHNLWQVSPHLRHPHWLVDLLRACAAALVMLLRPSRRDWRAMGSRIALRLGQSVGFVKYGLLKRIPPRQLGLGLES